MDWFKGKFTGKPHIYWENPWFPVDFPLNQSIEFKIHCKHSPNRSSPLKSAALMDSDDHVVKSAWKSMGFLGKSSP